MVLFRFLFLLIKRVFKSKMQGLYDETRTSFIVNPFDLDINFHVNNGRYLSIMDLGRFDLMIKTGSFFKLTRMGYYPVLSTATIRFKKSLQPFQRFVIVTKIDSLDEKDYYMSQKFFVKDELYAEAIVKGRFKKRGRKGSVPTDELVGIMGFENVQKVTEIASLQRTIESKLCQKPSEH